MPGSDRFGRKPAGRSGSIRVTPEYPLPGGERSPTSHRWEELKPAKLARGLSPGYDAMTDAVLDRRISADRRSGNR